MITKANRGGVHHPDVVVMDQLRDVLDSYGIGGRAIAIPKDTRLKDFFVRSEGEFYYDDPALSKSKDGPGTNRTYYIVVNAEIGYRSIYAHVHEDGLYLGTVFGDVFRGWNKLADHDWVVEKLKEHAASVDHPYATEKEQGFVKLATEEEALSRTNDKAAMTSIRVFKSIYQFGLGPEALKLSVSGNFETAVANAQGGYYYMEGYAGSSGLPDIKDVSGTAYVQIWNKNMTNKGIILSTQSGEHWTNTMVNSKLGTWRQRITFSDLPKINGHAQERGKDITITAGDVGAWTKEEADKRYILRSEGTLPTGTPLLYYGTVPPTGYISYNGQALNPTTTPKLYAMFGKNILDLRGVVLRGLDLNRGLDVGRALGSYQEDAMQQITGSFPCFTRWRAHEKLTGAFYRKEGQWNTNVKNGGGDDWGMTFAFDSGRIVRSAAETRMKNVAMMYITRAE